MIPGDVKNNDGLSEKFAERLSIGVPEARHLLCAISRSMSGELLASGSFSLGGVGTFSIAYVPSEKKTGASGIIYTSPRNRLVFDPKGSGRDDSRRIVPGWLSGADADSERCRKAFLAELSLAVKEKRDVRLKGFGTFASDDGNYTFFPERSFDELLNREYLNLDEVVLPPGDQDVSRTGSIAGRKTRRPFVTAGFLVLGGFLLLMFSLSGMPGVPELFLMEAQPDRHVAASAGRVALPGHPAVLAASVPVEQEHHAVTDSLALVKGDFTIVLATFRRAETAGMEARRIREEGIPVFVWPASLDGVDYFRIATGQYSTASEASDALREMKMRPDAQQACIQKVIKGVVLHGEKGL
jgi:nucleoid DNA-binding protein